MSVVSIPDAVAINIAGQCIRGKVREENQDTVRHISALLGDLLVVAEGVGIHAGGAQASQMAVDAISSSVESTPPFFPPEIAVEEAVCHANAAIAAAAAEPECPENRMGATVVVALLRTNADRGHAPVQAMIGHVGDSRAYLIRDQKLSLLTRDHSAAHDLADRYQFASQQVETQSEKALVTRQLGLELNIRVEIREVPLEVGDTLLLCSDGLWRNVSEQDIESILSDETHSVDEASCALVNLALDAGGHDSIAIEIARVTQNCDSSAATVRTVKPRTEAPPEIKSVRRFAPASDTFQSDWPNSPLFFKRANSANGVPPSKRKNVFSFIRGFGRQIPDKDAMTEKPAVAEPAAPSVSGVQPTVTWETPVPITYGTGLSLTQLNATASVHGKFLYTPGPGYVLPAGTHTLWVTFSAANSPDDNPVLAAVSIAVAKSTPSIQWPTPSSVPPGTALGAAQLNASASVPGTFEYSPVAGEVLSEGPHTLSVTFNPKDEANYTSTQASVSLTVAKTVPQISWMSPEPIPYGTPLGAAELNASASVAGTFEYLPAAGVVLSAGPHSLSVTFIPNDGTICATAVATVLLTVTPAKPAIVWPNPERMTYGAALNDTQLNATASVPGTFLYNPGPGSLLAAGEHTPSVVFTPSNLSDYIPAKAAVSLSVAKATPTISWPAPNSINSATPLSATQLNATASVAGTFAYSPAAGEALGSGNHTLSVTFTPADSVNYTPAQASVSLTIIEIIPAVITWLDPSPISYGKALGDEQLNASSPVPGSFVYTPASGDVLPPGLHKLSCIFTPEDREKYAVVKGSVALIVEGLPNTESLLGTDSQTMPDAEVTVQSALDASAERGIERMDDQPAQNLQRETRTYKGAIYEKGDDGQWHLQRN